MLGDCTAFSTLACGPVLGVNYSSWIFLLLAFMHSAHEPTTQGTILAALMGSLKAARAVVGSAGLLKSLTAIWQMKSIQLSSLPILLYRRSNDSTNNDCYNPEDETHHKANTFASVKFLSNLGLQCLF